MSEAMIEINGIPFTLSQAKAMSQKGLLNMGQKNDPSSTTPSSAPLHGVFPGNANMFGAFSNPGVRPERFSAMQRPRSMAGLLKPQKSELMNEIVGIVTGQTAATGTNATGWCAGGMLSGVLKTCQQTYPMGNFKMRSRIAVIQEAGMLRNRADIPGMILNNPPAENPLIPDPFWRLTDDRSILQLEFYNLGVQMERSLVKEIWQGVVGTDTGIPGWWKDMNSLSSLVKTGYVDSETGLACPAADSQVIAWNADVGATVAGRNIVQVYSDVYYAAVDRADAVGLGGTEFAFVMRKEAFRALVQVWVCQYYINRCLSAGVVGAPFTTDATETRRLELEMRNGQYLLIDGIPVRVVFDEGIPLEQLGANILRSDSFLLPISWNGYPLTRLEYFDMGNFYANELRTAVVTQSELINNGLYLLSKQESEGCVEFTISAKMRLFLETPFLAARIDDMSYTYLAQTHVADPGTSFLYVNGGVSYRL